MTSTFHMIRQMVIRYSKVNLLARRLMSTIPLSMRLGKRFWEWYAFFEESESWDLKTLEDFQLERIRILLHELVKTSRFYRLRLGDINLESITTLDDFRRIIPLLSRSEFREYYDKILSESWKTKRVMRSQTSGTTGNALQFYHLEDDQAREWAAICHQWKRVGYYPSESRRVEFRGLTTYGKLVDEYPEQNMIRCSILHFNREALIYYADAINKFRAHYYHGYPSALYLLASQVLNEGLTFPHPRAILLASEMVYEHQLAKIQEAFPNSRIFAHYGCAERTVLAGWCEFRREYHVLPQYSLVEIGNDHEIIGTNLYNTVNGFVRYRMTDVALDTTLSPCPDCHRPYVPRFKQLAGRVEDYLFSWENGWIPPAIVTYPLKSLKAIQEVQFYQKQETEIRVRYTVRPEDECMLEDDLVHVREGLARIFGKSMTFRFERVDGFERGPTGKFKWIINELEHAPHLR